MVPIFVDAQISNASKDDWPMFHHDPTHAGYITSEAVPTGPNVLWSHESESPVDYSPAIADGRVFATGYNLHAYNATTGSELWNEPNGGYCSPAVDGSYVFTIYNGCTAFNASTGAQIWSTPLFGATVGYSEALVVANDVVYESGGVVRALNASTGAELWSYAGKSQSAPAVVGNRLYYGSDDNNVYCVNASTGSRIWNYKTGGPVQSSPAVADDLIYIGSWDQNVYALNASTGAKVWSYRTGSYIDFSSPAIANGIVYIGSADNNIYALNASTSNKIWNFTTGGRVRSSPAIAANVVYVCSDDGNLYALKASTGEFLWNYTVQSISDSLGASFLASPALTSGNVYIGSFDHIIISIGSTASVPSPSVPEFSSWIILPALLIICTVAGVVIYRKRVL